MRSGHRTHSSAGAQRASSIFQWLALCRFALAPVAISLKNALNAFLEFGDPMHYSFTEKKRFRKNFAKRQSIHPVPFLLTTQLESFNDFLQADVAPERRKPAGLQGAFCPFFRLCRIMGLRGSNSFAIPCRIRPLTSKNANSAVKPIALHCAQRYVSYCLIANLQTNRSSRKFANKRFIWAKFH